MKIIKFRIKNYKSIKDSGDCYFDPKITILAGKNEAGKTAIVEALEDFNINKDIREEAIPISNKLLKPEIELLAELGKEDIEKINQEFNLGLKIIKKNEFLLIIKKIYPKDYTILDNSFTNLIPDKKVLTEKIIKLVKFFKEKITNFPFGEEDVEELDLLPDLKNYTPQFIEGLIEEEQNKIKIKIEKLTPDIEKLNAIKQFQKKFEDFMKENFIPNFILFKTFDDVLPDEISITEAPNNSLIKDLSFISNLDFNKIQPSAAPDDRKKHEEEVNLRFAEEYKEFWTQDHTNLYFWWDSNKVYFRIKEGEEFYKPAIRSKGRQWHLAYYIRITARSMEGKNNIILIDEPGLFLHAKAQKDILNKLEKCGEQTKIVYTTHSPYLIPPNNLSRLRLIIKSEENGTKIEKITARADKETLTPILTAIGEDLSAGIRVDKKNSIVVEGYSDYLWLIAFKKILNIQEELNFVPAVGADSSVYIGCILFGWGLDPIFILDNDKKGRQVKRKINKKLAVSEERIIFVPENKNGSIETLFSEEDFKKYIKTENNGKVLLATQLYQKIENKEIMLSDFSKETQDNFSKLFQNLINIVRK